MSDVPEIGAGGVIALPGMRGRAPRPITMRFESSHLVEKLDPLAQKRRQRFCWTGASYESCSRSLAPNLPSLDKHTEVLKPIVEIAPSGFPSHPNLSGCLVALHWRHAIFEGVVQGSRVHTIAAQSADRWRIMARHLYDLKKAQLDLRDSFPRIADILDLMDEPRASTATGEEPPQSAPVGDSLDLGSDTQKATNCGDIAGGIPMTAADVESLVAGISEAEHDDGSDVELLEHNGDDDDLTIMWGTAKCNCKECIVALAASWDPTKPQTTEPMITKPKTTEPKNTKPKTTVTNPMTIEPKTSLCTRRPVARVPSRIILVAVACNRT